MIIAVFRADKVASVPGDNHTVQNAASAVFARLGWTPSRVVPGKDKVFWAYR